MTTAIRMGEAMAAERGEIMEKLSGACKTKFAAEVNSPYRTPYFG